MRKYAAIIIASATTVLSPTLVCAQFVQQGPKLVGTGNEPLVGTQGYSIALSADGNTAIVGGPSDNHDLGAAWIFTRSGSTWTQQGPKLVGSGVVGTMAFQGETVAISADGNTAVVGGSSDDYTPGTPTGGGSIGAAWVFVRTGNTWAQQGPKLVGSGASGFAAQAYSVAISGDGNTILLGGPFDNGDLGAAWVFTRSGTTWSQQGPKLVGTGAAGSFIGLGVSVALSADGNTALVSGPGDGGPGAVWVFVRHGGIWTQQGEKLSGAASQSAWFGGEESVALSADGNTAAVGAYNEAAGTGGTWIFTRTGSTWTQQGSRLLGTGVSGDGAHQGRSVSLSGDGNMLIVGGPNDGFVRDPIDDFGNTSLFPVTGAAWVFRRNGTVWSQSGGKIVGQGSASVSYSSDRQQGADVAISADGRTAIVGKPSEAPTGAVWMFTAVPNDLRRAGDHDGDGRTEITLYHIPSGMWSSLLSTSGFTVGSSRSWGGPAYAAAPGDYDGDGKTDLGLYDGSTGAWYVLLSSTNFTTSLSKRVGGPGWTMVPRDFDGDGKTDFAVYNTTTGQWYGLNSSTNYTTTFSVFWGGTNYLQVPADYDGDGKADFGVYNLDTGVWSILLSSANYTTSVSKACGGTGWTPVPADYDGDGKADLVVYNYNPGTWYGLTSSGNYLTSISVNWGGASYQPVKGDYDGDGKADFAVYVSNTGMWYILLSGANYTTAITRAWGGPGWAAIPQFP
jgi:FG-GAP-like repeat